MSLLTINQRAMRIAVALAMSLSLAFAMAVSFTPTQVTAAGEVGCGPSGKDIFGCKGFTSGSGQNEGGTVGAGTGLSNAQSPRSIILGLINIAMGFLGLVAVVIILYGGFKWMTAAGNEEKVEEAKKLIGAGIIGLVIILTAYAIVTFVINTVISKTI
ncbi:hypothetical protein HZA86_02575 [Candidatus Uhrbacteria bacterium]|nr:hypothetical protein [Candidatus Uhrbacteria bacterium]